MERRIVVFSKPEDSIPRCQKCIATKRWMDSRNIEAEFRYTDDPEVLSYLKELLPQYMEAPVVAVFEDDVLVNHWSGFNPDEINKYLPQAA